MGELLKMKLFASSLVLAVSANTKADFDKNGCPAEIDIVSKDPAVAGTYEFNGPSDGRYSYRYKENSDIKLFYDKGMGVWLLRDYSTNLNVAYWDLLSEVDSWCYPSYGFSNGNLVISRIGPPAPPAPPTSTPPPSPPTSTTEKTTYPTKKPTPKECPNPPPEIIVNASHSKFAGTYEFDEMVNGYPAYRSKENRRGGQQVKLLKNDFGLWQIQDFSNKEVYGNWVSEGLCY